MSSTKRRLADFRQRAKMDPPIQLGDTSYITIHPFSNDVQLLSNIGAQAEDCVSVDAYWSIEGDVAFIQISNIKTGQRSIGQYVRLNKISGYVNFVSVVPELTISKQVFEQALRLWLDAGARKIVRNQDQLEDRLEIPSKYYSWL